MSELSHHSFANPLCAGAVFADDVAKPCREMLSFLSIATHAMGHQEVYPNGNSSIGRILDLVNDAIRTMEEHRLPWSGPQTASDPEPDRD